MATAQSSSLTAGPGVRAAALSPKPAALLPRGGRQQPRLPSAPAAVAAPAREVVVAPSPELIDPHRASGLGWPRDPFEEYRQATQLLDSLKTYTEELDMMVASIEASASMEQLGADMVRGERAGGGVGRQQLGHGGVQGGRRPRPTDALTVEWGGRGRM